MSGHLWFIRRFGFRAWLRYERARRAGATIDFAALFTPDELAVLEEHCLPTGKRIRKVERLS